MLFAILFVLWWKSEDIFKYLEAAKHQQTEHQLATGTPDSLLNASAYTFTYDTTLAWVMKHQGTPTDPMWVFYMDGGTTLEKVLYFDYGYDPFFHPRFDDDSAAYRLQGALDARVFWYEQTKGTDFMKEAQARADSADRIFNPDAALALAQRTADMHTVDSSGGYYWVRWNSMPDSTITLRDQLIEGGVADWINEDGMKTTKIEDPNDYAVRLFVSTDERASGYPYSQVMLGWVILQPSTRIDTVNKL